tara:strand:- start:9418 stop:10410 length:993 start_codon:yes stop_codon:yes gene_type:complete
MGNLKNKIPENTREVIKILEGYYAELSKKDYQLKAMELWKEFFIKKISETGRDISEINFSDKENGFTIGNETEVMNEYDGVKFDSVYFYLWWYENGELSDYEILDIELPVVPYSVTIIFNFKYEEDKVLMSFKDKYDSGFWGNIDEISYTLSRCPIFHLSEENKDRIIMDELAPTTAGKAKTYEYIFSIMKKLEPGYNSWKDYEMEKQLDAIFLCGYEWNENQGSGGFYHPKTKLYLKIRSLNTYSPESIIDTYNRVWSKNTPEIRDKFNKYPSLQVGFLFILSFSLFFFVEIKIALTVVIVLFIINFLFYKWNIAIEKKELKYRKSIDL